MAKKQTRYTPDPNKKKAELDAVMERLTNGINDLWKSDNFKDYLESVSKFHTYSTNNLILAKLQMPDFSRLASYKGWQALGRQVQRGEDGIKIRFPITVKYINLDGENIYSKNYTEQHKQMIKNGSIKERSFMNYDIGNVFDISQTKGRPLPSLAKRLEGNEYKHDLLFNSISNISKYPVVFEPMEESKGGYFRYNQVNSLGDDIKAIIAINDALDREHQVKTLIHEIAHSEIHADENGEPNRLYDSKTMEVQAESVAFVVCDHFGIDTSQYSFGYVGSWAKTKEATELTESLDVIKDNAGLLIDRIENELELMMEQFNTINVEILESSIPSLSKNMDFEEFSTFLAQANKYSSMLDEVAFVAQSTSADDSHIRYDKLYDCHTKEWNMKVDDIREIMGHYLKPEQIIDSGVKTGFANLSYSQMKLVDTLCKENGSILWVDNISPNEDMISNINQDMQIKITDPYDHELTTILNTSITTPKNLSMLFEDKNGVDIGEMSKAFKEADSDYSYFVVRESNGSMLCDGAYNEKYFQVLALEESRYTDFKNVKGKVDCFYKNKNGMYDPLSSVTLDLSKDLTSQFNKMLPDYESNKTDYFTNVINERFPDIKGISKLSPSSINIIGSTILSEPRSVVDLKSLKEHLTLQHKSDKKLLELVSDDQKDLIISRCDEDELAIKEASSLREPKQQVEIIAVPEL